ncbi:polysaccharide deacetylase family protein [Rhizobium lemnae]|uniref:Chitooligosaccharide deacetylase n=1 Tax=Rhizobium lemnae TaxID=1214924 RepID=A0ABV8EB77_9HYPH|nr:polysaccharide deacetylase family protein [Rhizobium lemnae]MCJ8510423.1 polysaccharide deacetylase family protein [Rhizobium lemnae]
MRTFVLLGLVCLAAPAFAAGESKVAVNVPAVNVAPPSAAARALLEPKLKIRDAPPGTAPRVALTFDACMGQADSRILSTLVYERIPATLFVTARWLRNNEEAIAILRAHPDLFDIENHGENHVPAVDVPVKIYGIPAAGSIAAVEREVAAGAAAVKAAGFSQPRWFRGATAKYDVSAIRQIRQMGYKIAGYSLNGDGGSLLGAAMTERKISGAKDGDVVIAHINQPTHEAGAGVVRGIMALKHKGIAFVRLSEVDGVGDAGTTQ